ncbi:Uncharacterised protein [Propionibacterium australiense]|uniref:Uncharacterized protein n=1 Tax=Propionibacterium australiense TaxID=119981 RepID=A0A383SA90_9ACTN|nr:Hypothetical protein PROPAUS_2716 [Propionibacterium australiense]VEH91737.1 Uncharacterised protein [Propionibacterium australiense]
MPWSGPYSALPQQYSPAPYRLPLAPQPASSPWYGQGSPWQGQNPAWPGVRTHHGPMAYRAGSLEAVTQTAPAPEANISLVRGTAIAALVYHGAIGPPPWLGPVVM